MATTIQTPMSDNQYVMGLGLATVQNDIRSDGWIPHARKGLEGEFQTALGDSIDLKIDDTSDSDDNISRIFTDAHDPKYATLARSMFSMVDPHVRGIAEIIHRNRAHICVEGLRYSLGEHIRKTYNKCDLATPIAVKIKNAIDHSVESCYNLLNGKFWIAIIMGHDIPDFWEQYDAMFCEKMHSLHLKSQMLATALDYDYALNHSLCIHSWIYKAIN